MSIITSSTWPCPGRKQQLHRISTLPAVACLPAWWRLLAGHLAAGIESESIDDGPRKMKVKLHTGGFAGTWFRLCSFGQFRKLAPVDALGNLVDDGHLHLCNPKLVRGHIFRVAGVAGVPVGQAFDTDAILLDTLNFVHVEGALQSVQISVIAAQGDAVLNAGKARQVVVRAVDRDPNRRLQTFISK